MENQLELCRVIEERQVNTMATYSKTGELITLPPEIVRMIALHLSVRRLLVCRQINSTWHSITNKILLRRDSIVVRCGRSLCFPIVTIKLSELNNTLYNSKRLGYLPEFPCTSFNFEGVKIHSEKFQDFLKLYGPQIKDLTLRSSECTVQNGIMVHLFNLLTLAPNITNLTFDPLPNIINLPGDESDVRLFPKTESKIVLPHLRKLIVNFTAYLDCIQIMEEILEAAINIEWTNIPSYGEQDGLTRVVSMNKLNAIREAEFNFWLIPYLEDFVHLRPQLYVLTLSVDFLYLFQENHDELRRGSEIVEKILNYSSSTLTTIEKFTPIGFLPPFQFPVLPKVKSINFKNVTVARSLILAPMFHEGINLATSFPILEEISIRLVHKEDFWPTFFPQVQPENCLPRVKTLKIEICGQIPFKNLSILCPNLKKLVCTSITRFEGTCREICENFKGLEYLHFEDVDGDFKENWFPAIDSGLTGFSHASVGFLSDLRGELKKSVMEKVREHPSLLEIKGLKTLRIHIKTKTILPLMISNVSGVYAFQRMPQLRVIVEATATPRDEIQPSLVAVAPFVQEVRSRQRDSYL